MIAGTLRGRRLATPAGGVRPTSDRVREAIFARLGDLGASRVLDLFAGSGALGIEAISRGADSLVCVDRSGRVLSVLQRNLRDLGIEERAQVLRSDARGALRRLGRADACFDLIFLDPPYAGDEMAAALDCIVETGVLAAGGVVVAESAKRHPVAPVAGLKLESERSYGDTVVSWMVREADSDAKGGSSQR